MNPPEHEETTAPELTDTELEVATGGAGRYAASFDVQILEHYLGNILTHGGFEGGSTPVDYP